MTDRMLWRLSMLPLFLFGAGIVACLLFGWIVPSILSGSSALVGVVGMSKDAAPWALAGFFVAGSAVAIYQLFQFIHWHQGKTDVCPQCGRLVSGIRNGRYGPYVKCLACGKNNSVG